MSLDVTSVGSASISGARDAMGLARLQRVSATTRVTAGAAAPPQVMPQEVLDAVDAAGRAYRALHEQGRQLAFSISEETGRVVIELKDLDGNVLRTIPPGKLLELATGGAP